MSVDLVLHHGTVVTGLPGAPRARAAAVHDGEFDTAFSETYYNDAFAWGIDVSTFPFDVETVALHESGHGLSQDHFGKIFRTEANGLLHFSPFAVMNASISRQAHELTGTDLQPVPDPGMQPMAICRLIPQCDSNADCVALCGTEGAKCVPR